MSREVKTPGGYHTEGANSVESCFSTTVFLHLVLHHAEGHAGPGRGMTAYYLCRDPGGDQNAHLLTRNREDPHTERPPRPRSLRGHVRKWVMMSMLEPWPGLCRLSSLWVWPAPVKESRVKLPEQKGLGRKLGASFQLTGVSQDSCAVSRPVRLWPESTSDVASVN